MNRLLDVYCRLLEGLMVFFLAAMVMLVFGNVVLRYVFNSGITVSEEMSRWLFVWLTFLGAVIAQHRHGHLGTDFLIGRLGPTGKRVCLVAGQVLMLGVIGLLLKGSWAQALINLDVQAPVTGLSMSIVYLAGIVFAVSVLVMIAYDLWKTLTGRYGDDELVMFQESEETDGVRAAMVPQESAKH